MGNAIGNGVAAGIGAGIGAGVGNRLGNRNNIGDRTNIGDRNNIGNQFGDTNINTGDIRLGNNNVINNRQNWSNLDSNRLNNINQNWGNQVGNLQNWQNANGARLDNWQNWGNDVRNNWDHYHDYGNWYGNNWWHDHAHDWCGWHYGQSFVNHPWGYWWTAPTYAAVSNWFSWPTPAPAEVWSQPVYYDYGQGGNVTYADNSVYVNNQPIATAEEFAQSASQLATVAPPPSEAEAEKAEWLALGTFVVSSGKKDLNPTRTVQLAVNKQGVVSGTLYNSETDQAQTVQGQVDKQTQRVAFRVGSSNDIVVETGIYNLTKDEAPALIHFGKDRVENYLLVRLKQPDEQSGG